MTNIKYAFIKDENVVNIAVFESLDENLLNLIKNEQSLSNIVLASDNAEIGGTYDGEKFWRIQPYSSWTKNQILNDWDPPVPYPIFNEDNPKYYRWNEDILNWEEIQASE